jgi:peptidoglycan-associated lipoprotein
MMSSQQFTTSRHGRFLHTAALLSAAFVLFATAGCHKKSAPLPPDAMAPGNTSIAPPTATISADPFAIDLGQSVVLNWRTTGATSVSIDGIGEVSINGTQTVSPANSTNFHLVAKGDGGTTEANVRVTVRVPVVPTMTGTSNGQDINSTTDMGSEAAFHQNVQDIFFDYDSFELRPEAQSSAAAAVRPNTTSRSAKTAPTPPRPPWWQPASRPTASASSATARSASSAPTKTKPAGSKTAAPSSASTAS